MSPPTSALYPPMTNGTNLIPHQALHPGLLIKDELAERKIKQTELAAETGIQATQLNEIIKSKRPLNAEQALLIGAALGISAQELTEAQANYDLHCAQIEVGTKARIIAVEELQALKQIIDIAYFRKEGIVTGRPASDVLGILRVHDCESITQLSEHLLKDVTEGALYKKSEKISEFKPFVNSWVRYVKHIAAAEKAPVFNFDCQEELLGEVKKVFQGTDVRKKLYTVLNNYGIKLIIKHKPDKTPLDGAAFWLGNNPVLGLTERHSRYDNFIFTVYHELGHIFLHLKDKKNRVVDYVDSLEAMGSSKLSQKESEANVFASDTIIPASRWVEFIQSTKSFNDIAIEKFANSVGIPEYSVFGRLCFEEHINYACSSVYKKNNIVP